MKIAALDCGADDVLTQLCGTDELLARVRAVVRRRYGHSESTLRCGRLELYNPFVIDSVDVGGVPVLMKALLEGGYLHGDCMTVTGKTIAENLRDVKFPTGQDVVRPTSRPLAPTASVCWCFWATA